MEKRIKLLSKAKASKELQWIEMELCKRDILYFCREYVYTDKNTNLFTGDETSIIPMIPFPFQEELVTEVWNSIMEWTKPISERTDLTNVFIEKSRQTWISWWMVVIFVYGFIFHNHKYLMISQKEDDVDKWWDMKALFEKARFIIRNLPNWMLPEWLTKETGKEYNKFKSISRKDWSGSITGESANPNASRWGTYNAIFLDEFAFMSCANTINTAAAAATPCRIFNSTPAWEGNEHYRMRKLTQWRKDSSGNDIKPEIKWLRYHWSEHPLYDSKWYEWRIKGMSKEQVAAEMEIDYNTAIVGRVYTDFPTEPTILQYDFNKPLYIAIDNSHGGTDPNAVIVMQPDGLYWNIIDYIEYNSTPEDSAYFLSGQPKMQISDIMYKFMERYKNYNYKKAVFIADPYDTKSAMGNSTILDDYRKVGINLMLPQERKKEEQILKTRTHLYRIRYNENCLDLASAIMNARYPERSENSQSTKIFTLPVHDWTSHWRTALEYLVTFLCENPLAEKRRVAEDTRMVRDYRTGQLVKR